MRTAWLLFLCVVLPATAGAQDAETDLGASRTYRNAFGAWGGMSLAAPGWWGAARGQEVFLLAVRYRRAVSRSSTLAVAYTFDLIPAAAVTKTPTRTRRFCCIGLPETVRSELERELERIEPGTAYGFGLSPLGLQLELFRDNPVSLAVGVAGGLLLFDRDVPRLDTRKMNFTATLDAGLRILILKDWEVTAGYRFHHLSNAGTGSLNPGLDSNMLFLGWMRR